MRDDRDRLADILNATERILEKAPPERIDLEPTRCCRFGFCITSKSLAKRPGLYQTNFATDILNKSGPKPSVYGTSWLIITSKSTLRNRPGSYLECY
jgi:hypothetical protein